MKGLSITNDSVSLEYNIENFTELVQGIDIQNLQVNGSNLLSASLSSTRNWDFAGVTRNDNILNLSTVSMDGISVNNIDPLFTLNLTLEENWSLITLSAPNLTVNDIDYQFTDLTIANIDQDLYDNLIVGTSSSEVLELKFDLVSLFNSSNCFLICLNLFNSI